MSNQIIPFQQQEKLALVIAKSGLFGIKTPEQALALMAIAEAEGLHPAVAARDYHVIQGRPALKADAMLARFQTAGGKVEWKKISDTEVCAVFSHPQGGEAEINWTIDMAKKAELTKNATWHKYPRQMLRARVISEGIRTVFPGVSVGIYTPEEVQDFDNGKTVEAEYKIVDEPPPAPPKPEKPNALDEDIVNGHAELIRSAETLDELRQRYAVAYKVATQHNDAAAGLLFAKIKDERKSELDSGTIGE